MVDIGAEKNLSSDLDLLPYSCLLFSFDADLRAFLSELDVLDEEVDEDDALRLSPDGGWELSLGPCLLELEPCESCLDFFIKLFPDDGDLKSFNRELVLEELFGEGPALDFIGRVVGGF